MGYVCEFGLLALPLVLMGLYVFRQGDRHLSPYVAPLTLILGITMMDMLLNATLTPMTWLTAGAILGHAEKLMPRKVAMPHRLEMQAAMGGQDGAKGKRTVM
ncbi:hypothetical protein [Sulfitobacter aestuariivivens]|uniref:hypothetical protein n=1 Tax=Sulfitobacter aestuariivivens TaxID=2766981 RepID=UPI0036182D36